MKMVLPSHKMFFQNRNTIAVILYTVIFSFAGFLLFYNLGDRLLWDDEAETAILAENIIKFGVPKITDGRNFVVLTGVEANNNNVWTASPWLQNYITSFSFLVLGKSTFAARFPFAVLGFLSVMFLAFITHRIYGSHELTITAVLLYVTCVSFLLHARQCRYYSILMFAQLWMIYGYWLLIRAKTLWGVTNVAFALATQFYCHYITFGANMLGLCVTTAINHRRLPGSLWAISAVLACTGALSVPWVIYAKMWNQHSYLALSEIFKGSSYYLLHIQFFIAPLVLFLIPFVVCVSRLIWRGSKDHCLTKGSLKIVSACGKERNSFGKSNNRDKFGKHGEEVISQNQINAIEVLLWILVPVHVLSLGSFKLTFFRYIVPMVPVLDILGAIILCRYFSCRLLRYPIIALLCLTNVIHLASAYPLGRMLSPTLPIITFFQEITTDYRDRLGDIVLFFKNNAGPDDSVYAFDNELALLFYTDLQIIDGRFNRQRVTLGNLPDWILTKSSTGIVNYPPVKLTDPVSQYYEPITISVHDTHGSASRPDPSLHVPFTVPQSTEIVIYKKVR